MDVDSTYRMAGELNDLKSYLNEVMEHSSFNVSKIKLSDQNEWKMTAGALSHESGGFFHVVGLDVGLQQEECLVLYQPQSALTGLAICRLNTTVYVLLQARVEPGNTGICQYGPTIQSTPANYLGWHGGKMSTGIGLFNTYQENVFPISNSEQLDLGKRYFHKSKAHQYIEVDHLSPIQRNMIWVPLNTIYEALEYDHFLNADLRSLLAIFDWDAFNNVTRRKGAAMESHALFYHALFERPQEPRCNRFVALDRLTRWNLTDAGVADLYDQGVSVGIYHTSTTVREVRSWAQPLMQCSNTGLVELVLRKVSGQTEFLISIQHEFGLIGNKAVFPTFVLYPGENKTSIVRGIQQGRIISSVIQSDEGGRFYQCNSIYQVIMIENEFSTGKDQYWINEDTLKQLLYTSNLVSFQLRCICSLLLKELNPGSFPV